MPDDMLKRGVNVGFSGGEKKRNEVLQMALLRAEAGDAGRDRQRARHRCAEDRGRRRERAARPGFLRAGHHPLPAPAGLHRARPRACAARRPHREERRAGTGAGAGSDGLRRASRRRHDGDAADGRRGLPRTASRACATRLPGARLPWVAGAARRGGRGLPRRRASRRAASRRGRYTDLARGGRGRLRRGADQRSTTRRTCRRPCAAARAVFVDGRFRADLSTLDGAALRGRTAWRRRCRRWRAGSARWRGRASSRWPR